VEREREREREREQRAPLIILRRGERKEKCGLTAEAF
jgi:hypothetical protein